MRQSAPPLSDTLTKKRSSLLFFFLQLAEGRVIAAGPGRRSALSGDLVPTSVKEGDTVLLPEYGGQALKLDSKEYVGWTGTEVERGRRRRRAPRLDLAKKKNTRAPARTHTDARLFFVSLSLLSLSLSLFPHSQVHSLPG